MCRRLFLPLAIVAASGLGLLCTGCLKGPATDPWASAGNKPKVLVSFAPLYCFAANVAEEDADVKCLLTATGPHNEGDATPKQIELARGCDVFVINGLGLEDESDGIAAKLQKVAANPKWNVLNLGTKIPAEWLRKIDEDDHDGHHHDHAADPHVWLSVRCAKKMVEAIRDELKRLDPAHAAGYNRRAAAYMAKLDGLETEGKELLAKKQEKSIISFHESLNYFAETYGLTIVGSIEVNPGQEPSQKKLDEIIEKCTRTKPPVRVIAVEPQYPSHSSAAKVLEALKGHQIDAQFAEVDPLETCDEAELSPDLYQKVMPNNLRELARVLR
jgi:ABC-type Zn uptake system ZnuABC Zn-binding protein ZnuA